jgi:hypothetical protein
MRRLIALVVLTVTGLLVAGQPAGAGPPGTSCPPGWDLAPVSILGSDFTGIADNVNHDGWICIRGLHNGAGVFIDNTAP